MEYKEVEGYSESHSLYPSVCQISPQLNRLNFRCSKFHALGTYPAFVRIYNPDLGSSMAVRRLRSITGGAHSEGPDHDEIEETVLDDDTPYEMLVELAQQQSRVGRSPLL